MALVVYSHVSFLGDGLSMVLLVQRREAIEGMVTILWSLGGVAVAALVLGLFAWWLRRRFLRSQAQQPMGMTLNDLRQMRDAGHLSEEEFEATRQTLLAKHHARQQADQQADAPPDIAREIERRGSGPADTNGAREPDTSDDRPDAATGSDDDESSDEPPER